MEAEAVKLIQETAVKASASVIDINGRKYTPCGAARIDEPMPDPLAVSTLQSVVDYLKSGADDEQAALAGALVHVFSPTCVRVVSPLIDGHQRAVTMLATATLPNAMSFGRFLPVEDFIIGVQAQFADADDRAKILALAGNITEESVRTSADDGVTQEVTARKGVQMKERATLPNPVILRPYRTFAEVAQPSSPFIFRAQQGPVLALYEADGGAWRIVAIASIKEWLKSKLDTFTIIG